MEEIRRDRREVIAGKQRMRRFEHFEDNEYGFGHRNKHENFHASTNAINRAMPVLDQYGVNITTGVGMVRNTAGEPRFDLLNHCEDLETDRAEIVRKIDELRDLSEEPKERTFSPARADVHRIGPYHTASVQEGPYPISPGHEPGLFPNGSCYSANSRHSYPHHGKLYYGDINYDRRFVLQPHEVISYKPEAPCSCVHCCVNENVSYSKNRHLRGNVDHPSVLCDRRSGFDYCHVNPVISQYHTRESATLESSYQSSSSSTSHCKKFVVPKIRDEVSWHPIAGGAPIITCCNCFELLKLPEKRMSPAKNQQKVKCGSCSSIILFEHGLVSFVSEQVPVEIDEDRPVKDECNKIFPNSSDTDACLNDASDHRFSPEEERKSLGNILLSSKHDFESSELPLIIESESTVNPESLCREISDKDDVSEQQMQRSESEKKAVANEFEDTMATEISVSLSELPNSSTSRESEKTSRDGNNSIDSGIFVNGHFIPDHEVKKAEKLAGPIQPGEYWYDTIAGFWGVMGHPCLGIIMPNIEEFSYPMPKNCAAGNTNVYVNGRELYERDFDLLTRRGLPHTRNRSYIIDMSGKVINEQTGQELHSLGRLAPTVGRTGHGFGMKVPRFIARLQT